LTSYKKLVEDAEREQTGERLIALVDVRSGMLLDHPWMTRPENREKLVDDDAFSGLLLRDEEWKQLDKLRTVVREKKPVSGEQFDVKYFDPIQKVDDEARRDYGMAWLAAFWPVGDTGWIAVVQERRDEALRPVREIQAGLVKYALIGLVLCLTFVATSWYFVRRMRSQVFRVPRRPGDGGASGSMSASSAEMHS
jgi:hypothetical protein